MKKQVRKICDDKIQNDKVHGWSVLPLRKAINKVKKVVNRIIF